MTLARVGPTVVVRLRADESFDSLLSRIAEKFGLPSNGALRRKQSRAAGRLTLSDGALVQGVEELEADDHVTYEHFDPEPAGDSESHSDSDGGGEFDGDSGSDSSYNVSEEGGNEEEQQRQEEAVVAAVAAAVGGQNRSFRRPQSRPILTPAMSLAYMAVR